MKKRLAEQGDYIKIIRGNGKNITKGKKYKVIYTASGWAGQAVTILGDNKKLLTVNGFWWDFA